LENIAKPGNSSRKPFVEEQNLFLMKMLFLTHNAWDYGEFPPAVKFNKQKFRT
jgi:hypothetical protein